MCTLFDILKPILKHTEKMITRLTLIALVSLLLTLFVAFATASNNLFYLSIAFAVFFVTFTQLLVIDAQQRAGED